MAVIICQNCQQRLEIPTGLGTIHVTCPTCGRSWDHRVEYIIRMKEATGDLTFYRDGDIHETSPTRPLDSLITTQRRNRHTESWATPFCTSR